MGVVAPDAGAAAESAASTPTTTTSATAAPGTASSTAKPGAPSIALVRQQPLLQLGAPALVLRVHVANAPSRAAVQVALHEATPSSLAFDDAITNDELPRHLDDTPVTADLTQIPTDSDGSLRISFPLQQRGERPLARTLKLIQAGVYALDVHLVRCATCRPLANAAPLVQCINCPMVDSFVTWVVAVSGAQPVGVNVTWVWQVATSPLGVDGALTDRTRNAFAEHGRLARVAAALDAAGSMPITVAASGETLTAWRATAQHDPGTARAFSNFQGAVRRVDPQFVLSPWVPLDVKAVNDAGFPNSVHDAFALESAAVHNAVGVFPERSTAWLDHSDAATMQQLRGLGVEQLGLRDTELEPVDAALEHQRVTVAGSPISVLTDDSFLSGLLRGRDAAPLRMQRFIAATALLAYDQPQRRTGVVLASASEWEPDRAMIVAFARALHDDPLLHATTLSDSFAEVTRGNDGSGGPLVRQFARRTPRPFAVPTAALQATARSLLGYESLLVGPPDEQLAASQRSLLVSMSALADPSDVLRRLGVIDTMVTDFSAGIHASARSVTVTAANTSIPITFTNDTGHAVRIRVRLLSNKLDQVHRSEDVTLPATGNHTASLAVHVKTSGRFVVSVLMTSIKGGLPIGQPARVTVNSRVFGSFGTWLTYGALAFLALWWAHHVFRRRRAAE